jgi:Predicted phosphohydrolases
MKRVLHISDLHFGRIHPPAIESLKSFLQNQTTKFDLIIMTGDWTQRARAKQFKEAAQFISELKIPVITVPGNHDLPVYNIFARILQPLKNYREFIAPLTSDTFVDDELAVVGFRTATFSRTVEGTILKHDIKRARKIFEVANPNALRIIACHHPLMEPNKETDIRPEYRVKQVLELKPHIIMSGHSHLNWIESVGKDGEHKIMHISAGSAVSNRLRGEVNSFHTIEIENKKVKIETYFLEPTGFITREKFAAQTLSY